MAKKSKIELQKKIEREYVIPLRKKYQKVPKHKRTPKAIKTIKEFLVKHMKIYDRNLKKIKFDKYLNEFIWFRGIKNPPAKIKIKVIKEGEIIKAELSELPNKLKFKKLREEKIEKKAEESKKKKPKEELEEKTEKKTEKTEEQKKEEEEKTKASEEVMKKLEKNQAKQMKHQTETKVKQPKRQQRKALSK
jgi:large subunit ribosomal protein L31e